MRARGVSRQRALVDISLGLGALNAKDHAWLLQEIGEDPETLLRASFDAGHLVLIEPSREAYWEGSHIQIDWQGHPRCWDLLWALAGRAKRSQPLHGKEFGKGVSSTVFSSLKERLVNSVALPGSLGLLIEPAGKGEYRLSLGPERFRLFRREYSETLAEVSG